MSIDDRQVLIHECEVMGRYLAGRTPSSVFTLRYAEAHSILLPGPHDPSDEALVLFVRKHPGFLPYVDAAAAVFQPKSLLRRKILLTVSLLEATPDYTRFFIHEGMSAVRVLLELTRIGTAAAFKFLVGCVIFPFAAGSK